MSYDPTDNWSHSSLNCIQQCAHKWYLRYIKRDWRTGPAFFKRGNTVHKIAEWAHKKQMIDRAIKDGEFFKRVKDPSMNDPKQLFLDGMEEAPGTPKAIEEAKDLAATRFEKEWTDRGGVRFEPGDDPKKVKAETREASIDMSAHYVDQVAPPLLPEAVEHSVKMTSTKLGEGITIKGYIDLITDDDGNEIIRDLKTAEKKPYGDPEGNNPNIDANESQQLSIYHLMRYADHKQKTGEGKLPKGGKLVTLVRTPKTHKNSVIVQETTRDMEDMKILMRRIKKAIQSAKAGIFLPANAGGYGSPCRYCEFADGTCEYVRKRGVD